MPSCRDLCPLYAHVYMKHLKERRREVYYNIKVTIWQYSSPLLTGTPHLSNKSILVRDRGVVLVTEKVHHMHSLYLMTKTSSVL